MFLQNDTNMTISYEVNSGGRKSMAPGERVTVIRVKSLHLYPYVPPPQPSQEWEPPAKLREGRPPKTAPVEVRLKFLASRIFNVEESEVMDSANLIYDLDASSIGLVLRSSNMII